MAELWALDAVDQARVVREHAVREDELVDAARRRVESLDPRLGALVGPLFDAPVRGSAPSGSPPFRAVPLLLKDAGQELAGTHHWIGTAALRDVGHRSTRTTELTARLLRAGFVAIGKTNVPELSAGSSTEPAALHPTRNPWAADRTAGGSSGGSAAAVAAGMVAVATGADATGSLRYPASACGVLTLKPTAGRVPSEVPAGGDDPLGMWCDFVLARTVRDLRAMWTIAAGRAAAAGRPPRLRVGVLRHDPILGLDVHPDCVAAVDEAAAVLEELGHAVIEDHPPALEPMAQVIAGDLMVVSDHTRLTQATWLESQLGRTLREGDLEPATLEKIESARTVTPERVAQAIAIVRRSAALALSWWQARDVLLTPVMRRPPWPLGEPAGIHRAGAFCVPSSLSGQPALSVPVARSRDRTPIGVQLVGRRGADEQLLDVAAELEARDTWPRWTELTYPTSRGGEPEAQSHDLG